MCFDRRTGSDAMKFPHRRTVLHFLAGAATLPAFPRIASALDYPTRPVRVVVDLPAGLAPDIIARLVAEPLSQRLGQPVVVENRPGAAGNIGTEYIVRAAPDGYTLLAAISGNAVNATLYKDLTFNFIRDTVPVAFLAMTPFVLVVNPSVPAQSIPEFIAYAKANPGKVNIATAGVGTAPQLAGELFKMMTGVQIVEVPYRSNFMPDVLGGQVQGTFVAIPPAVGSIRTGKLRALAVTGATRNAAIPDIAAMAEFVPGYEGSGWAGIVAPKDTPSEIIEKLNKEINVIITNPDLKERLVSIGAEPTAMTPAEFGKLIAEATDKWAKVIKFADIKPE
jgi:tripartite-type tricarboxylate transporter receptor subunit TctC